MQKLDTKYADILFKAFLALFMSVLMGFVITFMNLGLPLDFVLRWAYAVAAGFVISFPATLVAVPFAKRMVAAVTEKGPK